MDELCAAYGLMERLYWRTPAFYNGDEPITQRHRDLQERFLSGEFTNELRDDMRAFAEEMLK